MTLIIIKLTELLLIFYLRIINALRSWLKTLGCASFFVFGYLTKHSSLCYNNNNNNNNNKSFFIITVIKYNSHPANGSANRGGRVYKGILY